MKEVEPLHRFVRSNCVLISSPYKLENPPRGRVFYEIGAGEEIGLVHSACASVQPSSSVGLEGDRALPSPAQAVLLSSFPPPKMRMYKGP